MPDNRDHWWELRELADTVTIAIEVSHLLQERAIPSVRRYMSDEALRDLWLSGRSPGLTNVQRLMNLAMLLKVLGPEVSLNPVVEELRRVSEGKPTAPMVERCLRKLEVV